VDYKKNGKEEHEIVVQATQIWQDPHHIHRTASESR